MEKYVALLMLRSKLNLWSTQTELYGATASHPAICGCWQTANRRKKDHSKRALRSSSPAIRTAHGLRGCLLVLTGSMRSRGDLACHLRRGYGGDGCRGLLSLTSSQVWSPFFLCCQRLSGGWPVESISTYIPLPLILAMRL